MSDIAEDYVPEKVFSEEDWQHWTQEEIDDIKRRLLSGEDIHKVITPRINGWIVSYTKEQEIDDLMKMLETGVMEDFGLDGDAEETDILEGWDVKLSTGQGDDSDAMQESDHEDKYEDERYESPDEDENDDFPKDEEMTVTTDPYSQALSNIDNWNQLTNTNYREVYAIMQPLTENLTVKKIPQKYLPMMVLFRMWLHFQEKIGNIRVYRDEDQLNDYLHLSCIAITDLDFGDRWIQTASDDIKDKSTKWRLDLLVKPIITKNFLEKYCGLKKIDGRVENMTVTLTDGATQYTARSFSGNLWLTVTDHTNQDEINPRRSNAMIMKLVNDVLESEPTARQKLQKHFKDIFWSVASLQKMGLSTNDICSRCAADLNIVQ